MPRVRAVAFIFAVNAAWLPASHRASIQAMLSADGSSSASSAWRSEIASPAATGTSESPSRACAGYAAASDGWTVISGPDPPAGRGWSCRITYAVISLATLAMGTCRVAPGPSATPMPLMSAAEVPSAGHETAAADVAGPGGAAVPEVGFLVLAGALLLALWVVLMWYFPHVAIIRETRSGIGGAFAPDRSFTQRAFGEAAAAVLAFLLVFGLVGGWILAGRMLAP